MLLKQKVTRLKKDVEGHLDIHESTEGGLSREEALAKFTGAFQRARLAMPVFKGSDSVEDMFAAVSEHISALEKVVKKTPGIKEAPAPARAHEHGYKKSPAPGAKKDS